MKPTRRLDPLEIAARLDRAGLRPSAQRVAIAAYVLETADHPSADEVWNRVRVDFPMVSRATVYNTLLAFRDAGLLRQFVLAEGCVVYDPKTEPHHHFVDDDTGAIHDIPWSAIAVGKLDALEGVAVREYMVVVRGRSLTAAAGAAKGKAKKA
ncbi:MAG: transcriptional repressor [Planctomycetes bacterium]|nr:transcriptional repressor [Planctomycetota bacterium]MCC7399076.1 transcriptional repressor [Planctomycetota bacterium]